jgi:hypothetical protein
MSAEQQLSSSWFPGEQFFTDDITLPDFSRERQLIIYKIVAAIFVFVIVLPVLFASKQQQVELVEQSSDASTDCDASTAASPSSATKRGSKKRANKSKSVNVKKVSSPPKIELSSSEEAATATVINPIISNLLNLICIIVIFFITFLNDNNLFAARTILQAPIFTREECQHIIDMAHAAAQRNAESAQRDKASLLLQHHDLKDEDIMTTTQQQQDGNATTTYSEEQYKLNKLNSIIRDPFGWKKDRHTSYPTTDLNLVTDPFTAEDRAYLAERLNARLAPVVERAFGISRGAIRANDIFIVRYDATKGQQKLRRHRDSSHLSFNILLNDEFEGGGTRFHNTMEETFVDIKPDVGEALLSHAEILHEGLATTKGTRYILVGFNSIDEKDPLTGEETNLSLFASWLNFPWMQVRFKEGFEEGTKTRRSTVDGNVDEWQDGRYATSLFRDLAEALRWFCDRYSTFQNIKLVEQKNFDKYLQVMDEASEERSKEEERNGVTQQSRSSGYANWFAGQQLFLGVDGKLKTVWRSRAENEDKFRDDL